ARAHIHVLATTTIIRIGLEASAAHEGVWQRLGNDEPQIAILKLFDRQLGLVTAKQGSKVVLGKRDVEEMQSGALALVVLEAANVVRGKVLKIVVVNILPLDHDRLSGHA